MSASSETLGIRGEGCYCCAKTASCYFDCAMCEVARGGDLSLPNPRYMLCKDCAYEHVCIACGVAADISDIKAMSDVASSSQSTSEGSDGDSEEEVGPHALDREGFREEGRHEGSAATRARPKGVRRPLPESPAKVRAPPFIAEYTCGPEVEPAHSSGGRLGDDSHATGEDPPVKIHPLEAQCIAQERWSTLVEHRAAQNSMGSSGSASTQRVSDIVLLTFSRHTKDWSDAVLSSDPARTALACGVEVQLTWANGAKIFVEDVGPQDFEDDLAAYHVVVYARDELAIFEALRTLSYNVRKLKASGRSVLPNDLSMMGVSDGEESDEAGVVEACDMIEVKVKYGFIHVGVRESWKDSRSVWTV